MASVAVSKYNSDADTCIAIRSKSRQLAYNPSLGLASLGHAIPYHEMGPWINSKKWCTVFTTIYLKVTKKVEGLAFYTLTCSLGVASLQPFAELPGADHLLQTLWKRRGENLPPLLLYTASASSRRAGLVRTRSRGPLRAAGLAGLRAC